MNDTLHQLQQRLLTLHHGYFQDDTYLRAWCTPAISALLLARGTVLRPDKVVYGVGVPMRCHENALSYATLHTTATAHFGFGLFKGLWWVHSFCVEGDGVMIDSSPEPCAVYFGIEWREVYPLIPKRGGGVCVEELPPVLQPPKKNIKNLSGYTTLHPPGVSPLYPVDFIREAQQRECALTPRIS